MDKDQVVRNLIIQYLEDCSKTDTEHADELEVSIECLKNMWGIENPSANSFGIKSLIDLVPQMKYDTNRAMKLKTDGNAALQAGDLDRAIQLYTEAISVDPTQSTFYCNRAAVYTKKEEHEKAIEDAEKALKLDPKYANAYSRLGFALWSLNRLEEARDVYKRGVNACPENASLRESLKSLEQEMPKTGGANPDFMNNIAGMFAGNPMLSQFAEKFNTPHVQEMLQDPEMAGLLQELQSNPSAILTKMNDPRMMKLLSAIMS